VREPRHPCEIGTRMQPLARLPVFFALESRRVVVVGDSAAAAWKVELLAAAGAQVDAFAPEACEELLALAESPPPPRERQQGNVTLHRRGWCEADLAGAALAVGAFDDEAEAAPFAAAARTAGVPVNVVDRPAFCDFAFGSIVNRSPLVIGISTDGAAPVFAQAIRARIEAMLPRGFAAWMVAAQRWRGRLHTVTAAGRQRFWQLFTNAAFRQPDRAPSDEDFAALGQAVEQGSATLEQGSVILVGAGPGDPELLTLRALRALQAADVILFDDLVSRDILDFARREAKKMLVGKTGHAPSCRQDDINALMVGLARRGKRVVRLKGGDPMIFGRAEEEIAACRNANVAVEVIPGITAAQGAAARLGLSLTERRTARRVQYVTGHDRNGQLPADIDWTALTDPAATTVVYMPGRTLRELADRAMAHGLPSDTPALAVARATRPDQQVIADTIAKLPQRLADEPLDGPLLVMIGRALPTPAALAASAVDAADRLALEGVSFRGKRDAF
jgi:uroporphyrin-III C-methyltransferase/precorrin-2 dehydrogenase/sirohydrochlorin ferrochelatase